MLDIEWDRHRLVDVSLKVVPGVGDGRLALRRYTFEIDGSFGNEVDTVTHLGTHVEAPAHYYEDAQDVTAYPPELFIGPMVHLRFSEVEPRGDITLGMARKEAEGVDLADKIVVLSSPHFRHDLRDDQRAVLEYEVTEFLVNLGIRMTGFDDSITIDVSADLAQKTHRPLFDSGILILEYLGQLDELRKKESYLTALPLRVAGFDSSPVRAVVIEDRQRGISPEELVYASTGEDKEGCGQHRASGCGGADAKARRGQDRGKGLRYLRHRHPHIS